MKTTTKYITSLMILIFSIYHTQAQISVYSASSGWDGNTCHGLIAVNASGDAGPFDVVILQVQDDGSLLPQVNTTLDGLENNQYLYNTLYPRDYKIIVTDALGCVTEETVKIFCGCKIILDIREDYLTIDSPSSCNTSDGSIAYASPSFRPMLEDATAPLTFSWSDGFTSDKFDRDGLAPGPITLTIIDANECTVSQSFDIRADDEPSFNKVEDRPCKGYSNGRILIRDVFAFVNPLPDPLPTYSFTWTFDTGEVGEETVETTSLINIPSGTYKLTITNDITGCTYDHTFIIEDLPDCGDFNVDMSTVETQKSCKDSPTGAAMVDAEGGNPSLFEGAFPAICGSQTGYSFKWSKSGSSTVISSEQILTNQFAGDYTVTVTDKCGREAVSGIITIEEYPEISIEVEGVPGCVGQGAIEITSITGGGDGNFSLNDYDVQWISIPENGNSLIKNELAEGLYDVEFIITNKTTGCSTNIIKSDILVDTYPEVIISFPESRSACFVPASILEHMLGTNNEQPWINTTGLVKPQISIDDGISYVGEVYENLNESSLNFEWRRVIDDEIIREGKDITDIGPFDWENDLDDFLTIELTVTDPFDCTYKNGITVLNNATVSPLNSSQECGFTVNCHDGLSPVKMILHQDIGYVHDKVKACCFTNSCFEWDCICEYELVPRGVYTGGSIQELDEGNFPDMSHTFEINERLGPNCTIITECPPEFDNSCKGHGVMGSSPRNSTDCEFALTSISPSPFDLALSHDDITMTFDIPEKGGDVIIKIYEEENYPNGPTLISSVTPFFQEGSREHTIEFSPPCLGEYIITFEFQLAKELQASLVVINNTVSCQADLDDQDAIESLASTYCISDDINCEFWSIDAVYPNPFSISSTSPQMEITSTSSGVADLLLLNKDNEVLNNVNMNISNGTNTYSLSELFSNISNSGILTVEVSYQGTIQVFDLLGINRPTISNDDEDIYHGFELNSGIENNIIRTSIEQEDHSESVIIFPNPFNENIYIQSTKSYERNINNVKIYNIAGKLVLEKECKQLPSIKTFELNLQNLTTGAYFLQINNGVSVISKRIYKI